MGVLLSPLTCRTFLGAHPTGHGFPGAPSSSKLQMIMAADTAHQETQEAKSTEMQQKKKRRKKKVNTTPETAQNAASAFIYHSSPNIALAMSRPLRKCWAWLGKLWVRNALHALQQPRSVQSSGMEWS